MQETLLRAWQRPNVLDQSTTSARAWLFTVARNLAVDEHRSARSRREFRTGHPPEQAAPDQADRALDGWLIADALGRLSADHREVIVRAYYRRAVDPPDRRRTRHCGEHGEIPHALRHAGATAGATGDGGDEPMTDIAGGSRAGSNTDDYTTWDAPYVLGSLTRTERREYEAHLIGRPDCRAAVSELAGCPDCSPSSNPTRHRR